MFAVALFWSENTTIVPPNSVVGSDWKRWWVAVKENHLSESIYPSTSAASCRLLKPPETETWTPIGQEFKIVWLVGKDGKWFYQKENDLSESIYPFLSKTHKNRQGIRFLIQTLNVNFLHFSNLSLNFYLWQDSWGAKQVFYVLYVIKLPCASKSLQTVCHPKLYIGQVY